MKLPLMLCLLSISATALAAGKAHEHGKAKLDVGVEATKITLQLETPLDNLLGFERAPRNEAERKRVDAAVARLRDAGALFRIDPAAGCQPGAVELVSPALKLGPPAQGDAGHADLDGSFEFVCTDAAKAAYIDVGLFEFQRLQQLTVQVATSKGQQQRTLKRASPRLTLAR